MAKTPRKRTRQQAGPAIADVKPITFESFMISSDGEMIVIEVHGFGLLRQNLSFGSRHYVFRL